MTIKYIDYPEEIMHNKIGIIGFSLSSFSFVIYLSILIFEFIRGFNKNNIYNFLFFIIIIINIIVICFNIIFNTSIYDKIMTKLNGLKKTNEELHVTEEIKYELNKQIIIFPIVSFVYLCIIILGLIGLNYKCNIRNLIKII